MSAHCGEVLAPLKTPKQVVFTDALPKSARGKSYRKALTETGKKENAVVVKGAHLRNLV